MIKIRDRVLLAVVAGLAGDLAKTAVDEASLRLHISQRPYRIAATGPWLNNRKEASSLAGNIFGAMQDLGTSMLGSLGIINLLSRYGREHLVLKGLLSGISIGVLINFLIGAFPKNDIIISPKDAASNLSYIVSHGVYGVVAAATASLLGDPSLYDVAPRNNYLPSTQQNLDVRHIRGYARRVSQSGGDPT